MRWEDGFVRVFISHLTIQKVLANEVASTLEGMGIDAFVAHDDIPGSQPWKEEIVTALRECDAIALLLSDGFYSSEWCDQETGMAFAFEKKLIPIRLDELFPRGWAKDFQAHDCRHSNASGIADEIFRALMFDPRHAPKLQRGLIASLGDSHSFRVADERARRLENFVPIDVWQTDSDLVDALVETLQNSQVSDAFGAGAYVRKIQAQYWVPF